MTDSVGKYSSTAQVIWTGTGYSAFAGTIIFICANFPHFLLLAMEATLDSLKITYIDSSGSIKYEYSLVNPNSAVVVKHPTSNPITAPPADAPLPLRPIELPHQPRTDKKFSMKTPQVVAAIFGIASAGIFVFSLISYALLSMSKKGIHRLKRIKYAASNMLGRRRVQFDGDDQSTKSIYKSNPKTKNKLIAASLTEFKRDEESLLKVPVADDGSSISVYTAYEEGINDSIYSPTTRTLLGSDHREVDMFQIKEATKEHRRAKTGPF